MKVCPVCKAVAFDDAAVCYGCLHDFEGGVGASTGLPDPESDFFSDAVQNTEPPRTVTRAGALAEFVIRFTPKANPSGEVAWSCAVES